VTTPLPAAPSLEQLRHRAKDLLRAARAGDPAAAARVAEHHPNPPDPLKLSAAQHVIAREHGFGSWPRLKAYVDRVAAHGPDLEHPFHEDIDYYEGRAYGLRASAEDGTEGAVEAFERERVPLTTAGARTVVARRHGFPSWVALRRHVSTLRDGGEPFARAYRALEAHDLDAFRVQLDRFPDLVLARGTNGNDLLGMAGGTGDERLVELLLERGADPASANAHGWTALHQAAYSDQPSLARRMLAAGTPPTASARGDGGTPLIVALFWGNVETAELLAQAAGIHPRNLRAAAGLGRADLIAEMVARDGTLAPEAGAHRSFYRPHSGFPPWRPSDDLPEIRDEALSWAARSDRVEAIALLVERGADPNADVNRGTPLSWAAACDRPRAIARLIALGADPSGRSTFGGPDHGRAVTPLHLAAQGGRRAAIQALLEAGADPTLRDGLHDGTPADWAEHGGHAAIAKTLRARGG
jgi:ankyrin repeat protein